MDGMTTDRPVQTVPFAEDVLSETARRTVRISPAGTVKSRKGTYLMDREAALAIIADFEQHGTPIPIDWDHQSLGGPYAAPDGRAPAAGWIHRLSFTEGEGLFGEVEWNAKAVADIRGGAYRYLSPVVRLDSETRRAFRLHSVALVNLPAIPKQDALAASDRINPDTETISMADEPETTNETEQEDGRRAVQLVKQIADAMGIAARTPTAALQAILAKVLAMKSAGSDAAGSDAAVAASVRELLSLPPDAGKNEVVLAMKSAGSDAAGELAAMKEAEAERLATERVQKHVMANRVNPHDKAQYGAALALARENPDRFEDIMGSLPPYVPPGRTEPPTHRQTLVAKAESEWKRDPALQKGCSCAAHVNLALRDSGLDELTEAERAEFVAA
jgi:hypothetical protein